MLIIRSSYQGSLLSFLANPDREPAISDLHDLANALKTGNYRCGTYIGSPMEDDLEALDGELKVIADHVSKHKEECYGEMKDGIRLVLEGHYAMYDYSTDALMFSKILGVSHRLHFSEGIYSVSSGLGYRKRFAYKRQFDIHIRRCFETGLLRLWFEKFEHRIEIEEKGNTSFKHVSSITAVSPLTMSDIMGPVLVLACGYAISVITLTAEIAVRKFYHRQKNPRVKQLKVFCVSK